MIRIRLARVGKKGRPSYRIVVADVTAPRDGSYLEWIGNYDPMADPPTVTLKNERASHWLSMGAVPSDAVARLMDQNGLMERSHTFKTATKKSAEEESNSTAPAPAPAAIATPPADETPTEEADAEDESVTEDTATE